MKKSDTKERRGIDKHGRLTPDSPSSCMAGCIVEGEAVPSLPPLPGNDPWDVRCGVFWMNDREIFQDTDADLMRKAAAFHDAGCNWVMMFSCTHFRWSFYRYWDRINAALKRIVDACHAHGIRVIEHHSAVLTKAPRDTEGIAWAERCMNIRKSSLKTWPDMIGGYQNNPEIIDGKKLTDLYYIDGRTGQPLYGTGYKGYIICVNNPFYRRAYFKYLESVYATGVDGIMTDDVGYSFYACTCEFCRRDFKEQTGYDLPENGSEFEKWHGNWNDPVFRAFIDFRRHVVERYHLAVKQHYELCGLKLFRPNYEAKVFQQHRCAYCLQNLPALDLVWQEAGGAHILDYSWPTWAVEAAQRFAIGRCRNIPSALFAYPTRVNQLKLTWGLAMSWGQGFTGTGEGYVNMQGERPLREFELRHAGYLRRVEKFSDLAFYDSQFNRNNTFEYEKGPRDRLMGWALSCYMSNIPFDIMETEELAARIGLYRLIILREIRFMAAWEIALFKKFMQAGGVVLWAGDTGRSNPDWTERPATTIAARFSLPEFTFPEQNDDMITYQVGSGKLVTCGVNFLSADYEHEHQLSWWSFDPSQKPTIPFRRLSDRDKAIREKLVSCLTDLLGGEFAFKTENLPAGVLATAFLTEHRQAVMIHLVNAAGILDKPDGTPVGHEDMDAITFPGHTGKPASVLNLDLSGVAKLSDNPCVKYFDPDSRDCNGIPLVARVMNDRKLHITVPAELLGAYGMIIVSALNPSSCRKNKKIRWQLPEFKAWSKVSATGGSVFGG